MDVVFYREGVTDTVGVGQTDGQRIILYDDRRGTSGTLTYRGNFFMGHLPLLLHPGTPRRVLHICFGVGNSLSAVGAHDEVERIDNVELSPHAIEAAPYFWTNNGINHDPRVRTVIDDGRNFLMASPDTYDVIQLEPPGFVTAGVVNLYTREFYQDAYAHLAPDGVMMQWIPVGPAPLEEARMLFRAFAEVFPHTTVWRQVDGPLLAIGTKQPLRIDYQALKAKIARGRVGRDFELIGAADVDYVLAQFILGEDAVAELVRGVPPVTDDRTVIDFTIPRDVGSAFGFGGLGEQASKDGRNPIAVALERHQYFRSHQSPIVPYLTNLGGEAPDAVEARVARFRTTRPPFHPSRGEADWHRW
jgi:spermidine synthase